MDFKKYFSIHVLLTDLNSIWCKTLQNLKRQELEKVSYENNVNPAKMEATIDIGFMVRKGQVAAA